RFVEARAREHRKVLDVVASPAQHRADDESAVPEEQEHRGEAVGARVTRLDDGDAFPESGERVHADRELTRSVRMLRRRPTEVKRRTDGHFRTGLLVL